MQLTRGRQGFYTNKPTMGQQCKYMFHASDSPGVGSFVHLCLQFLLFYQNPARHDGTSPAPVRVDLMLLYRATHQISLASSLTMYLNSSALTLIFETRHLLYLYLHPILQPMTNSFSNDSIRLTDYGVMIVYFRPKNMNSSSASQI